MKKTLITFFLCILYTLNYAQPGAIDPSFNPGDLGFGNVDGADNDVYTTALQSDGKIIIGGDFTMYNGTARIRIARLNADGTLDATFNPGTGANIRVWTSVLQPDGKIIIGGSFTLYNGTARACIARLNTDGTLDATFDPGTGADSWVSTIALQPDGKIIIGGQFTTYNGTGRNKIARLNADGTLDATFNPGTGADNDVYTTALQPDGKIIIGGEFTMYNGTARIRIARLNADGTLDATFNPGTGTNGQIYTTALQSDGKIIIGGNFTLYNGTGSNYITRLNADGTLDATFTPGTGASGTVWTSALQPDGKIIMGGEFTTYNGTGRNSIARLNADGTLDTTFDPGTGASNRVLTTALQPDGKIIIGGWFTFYNGTGRRRIARLNADGTMDATFNPPGTGANGTVETTALQPDGKIIIGGDFNFYNGTPINHIARLNADGTLDATFTPGTGANGTVWTTALQPDGKIIIGGDFTNYNGTPINHIARLNADGTLDATFNPGTGANNRVLTTAIQPDGKIIIGGEFTALNGGGRFVFRLNADGTLDATFTPGSGPNQRVHTIALQPDGKIIIGGAFTFYSGAFINRIARLNANGTRDVTFTPGTGASSTVLTSALQPDGKIIIGGQFTSYNGTGSNYITRLNANGTLDATFTPGTGASSTVQTSAIQPDGKIIIGGLFTSYNGTGSNRIARLNANGTLDATFNPGTGADNYVATTALQPNGKIIIGGIFTSYDGTGKNRIARILGDCTPTTSSFSVSACNSYTVPSGISTYTTSQTVMDTIPNAAGCDSIMTIMITINSLPTVTAMSGAICIGQSYTIMPSGAGTYTYSSGSAVVTPTATSNYTVAGTDGNGCENSTALTLTVNALPTITVNSDDICLGSSFTITPNGATTYTYSSGSNIVSPTSTSSYTVTGTDNNGCENTAVSSVTVITVSASSAITSSIICYGGVGLVQITATGGDAPYTGVSTYTVLAGNNTFTVTDNNGCLATTTISVPQPSQILTTQSASICAGASFTVGTSTYTATNIYTNILTAANGCDSTVITNLYVYPTITTTQSYTLCAGQSVNVVGSIYSSTGTYTNSIIGANGCTNYIVSSVFVKPAISKTQTISICANSSYQIGTSTYNIAGTYTNVLTAVDGCDSTVYTTLDVKPIFAKTQNIAICVGQTYTIGTSAYTSAGTYTNVLTAINGCDSIVVTVLLVNPLPIVTINSGEICIGNIFTLTANGAVTYTYSSGSNVVSPNATTNYTVLATDINGCKNSAITTVTVNPLPTIDAGDDITLVLGETHQFNPTQTNAVTYTWTTSGGLNNANIINPISSTQTDITYTISVSSAKGCLASDEVSVKIYNEFFINNFVSPNGDGNNDTWKISVPYLVKDCALEIFDQWGTKVFSKANNYENEWDAKNMVDGVYYYLFIENGKMKYNGSITILR